MKRSIKYFGIILLCIVFTKVYSQDSLNASSIESKSYQLYSDHNWKELISFCNKALDNGNDYFYLRMRIGIAYFENKNYANADAHFKKALGFDSSNELALEYLYYCYTYMGRYEEAKKLSLQFSEELLQKVGISNKTAVSFMNFEGGSKITDSAYYYNKGEKAKTNYFSPPLYFQIGLNHYVKSKWSLFHAFTYFTQNSFIGSVSQAQYFIKGSIPLKNNWLISPSLHLLNVKSSTEAVTTSTMYAPYPGGIQPPPGSPLPPVIYQTNTTNVTTSSNYILASFSAQKIIQKFTFGVGTTVSNIGSNTQLIHNGSVYYSIFGNSKLILGTTGYVNTIDSYKTTYGSVSPFVYIQPVNALSIKVSCLLNSGNNIIEDNGYLVNNSPDFTKSRWSAMATVQMSKRFSLYGLYQLENKTEVKQQFKYNYHVVVFGLRFVPK